MSCKLYLLYSVLDNDKKNGLKFKDIIKYYMPFLLYSSDVLEDNKYLGNNYLVESISMITLLNKYVDKNILYFNNNRYSINIKHPDYITYNNYISKMNTCISKTIKTLSMSTKIEDSDEEDSGEEDSDEEDSDEEDSDEEDSQEDIIKEISSVIEETPLDKEEYYICESFQYDIYYLVSKTFTTCTCKSFEFCKEVVKKCKHIDYCKGNIDKLTIYNLKSHMCSCNHYLSNNDCEHVKIFKNM